MTEKCCQTVASERLLHRKDAGENRHGDPADGPASGEPAHENCTVICPGRGGRKTESATRTSVPTVRMAQTLVMPSVCSLRLTRRDSTALSLAGSPFRA